MEMSTSHGAVQEFSWVRLSRSISSSLLPLLFLLLSPSLFSPRVSAAPLPPPKETLPDPDALGKTPITLTANSLDLDELCAELSKQANVKLEADRDVKDRKVTGRFVKRPLQEVLQAVEDLFGYRLRYYEKTKRYVFYRGEYDKRVAAIQNQGKEDLRRRFEAIRKGFAQDPRLQDDFNVFPRLMTQLPQEAVEKLFKEGAYQTPYDELSPRDRNAIYDRLSWRMGKNPPDKAFEPVGKDEFINSPLLYKVSGESPNLSLWVGVRVKSAIIFDVLLADKNEIDMCVRENYIRVPSTVLIGDKRVPILGPQDYDPLELEAKTPAPPKPKNKPSLPQKVRVMFKDAPPPQEYTGAYNTPLTPTDDLFQTFAHDADLEFLADSFYNVQPTVPKDIRDQPLDQALEAFTTAFNYTWDRPHGLFLFRNVNWFQDDEREASAKSTRRWVRYWSERYRLKQPLQLKEFTALAYTLTGAQIRSFGMMNPLADHVTGVAGPFALYEALDAPQRATMSSADGLLWRKMTVTQQRLLLDRVPVKARPTVIERLNGDPDSRLRIREMEGKIVSDFTMGGKWIQDVSVQTDCPPKPVDFDAPGGIWVKDGGDY